MLDVLEVEDAGEEAEDAVVRVEFPSATFLGVPLGGEAADPAATEDLEEVPGGDVKPDADLLVPGATKGVGLFLEVEVERS